MARTASAVSAHFMRRIIATSFLVMIAERHAHCPGPDDARADRATGIDRQAAEGRRRCRRGYAVAVAQIFDIGLEVELAEGEPGIEIDDIIGPNMPVSAESGDE